MSELGKTPEHIATAKAVPANEQLEAAKWQPVRRNLNLGGDMEKFEILEPEVRATFMSSLVQHLKIEEIRKFITVPVPAYGSNPTMVPIQEYADYLHITEDNVIENARILGAGCAILYNALLKNARLVNQHNTVIDLLENKNLKFSFVMNAEPSVADPSALIPGWISFRFHFASANVATSTKPGVTLSTLEEYAK